MVSNKGDIILRHFISIVRSIKKYSTNEVKR